MTRGMRRQRHHRGGGPNPELVAVIAIVAVAGLLGALISGVEFWHGGGLIMIAAFVVTVTVIGGIMVIRDRD